MVPYAVPPAFAALVADRAPAAGPSGADWVRALPALVARALDRWDLGLDGPAWHGTHTLVVPVRRADDAPAVVTATWPHDAARHGHLALRAWAGRGAVRLLAADPGSWTLLLKRLDPDRPLHAEPIDVACATIGRLLSELDRPALPVLDTLSGWLGDLTHALDLPVPPGRPRLPRRFLDQARALARDLRDDPGLDDRLIATDLHDGGVLATPGRHGEWRATTPRPRAGTPAFAVWPMLVRGGADLGDDPRRGVRRRLQWICEPAGIDPEQGRAWALLRTVEDALAGPRREGGDLTGHVTLLKALQPGP